MLNSASKHQLHEALKGRLGAFAARYGDTHDDFKSPGLFRSFNGLDSHASGAPDGAPATVLGRTQQYLHAALQAAGGDLTEASNLLIEAYRGESGSAAARQLQAARIEVVDNTIWADAQIAPLFFKVETLQPGDRPVIHNTTKQATTVAVMSEDGEPKHIKLNTSYGETVIDLYYISTQKIDYKPRSITGGDVASAMLATLDLGFDLSEKVDDAAMTLLAASVEASWTGNTNANRALRRFVTRGAVNASNLPAGNLITVTGSTTSTVFRVEVLDAILKYCDSWGKAFSDLPGGMLRPTGVILVPSSETTQILSTLGITSASTNRTAAEVQMNYLSFHRGIQWTLVPSNRLAPGSCWAQLNAPVGTIFTMPSLDEEVDTGLDPVARMRNKAYRQMSKVATPYIIGQHTPRALKLIYTTES